MTVTNIGLLVMLRFHLPPEWQNAASLCLGRGGGWGVEGGESVMRRERELWGNRLETNNLRSNVRKCVAQNLNSTARV